ncbi:hypothetical protein HMN09_00449700 [Mycena chlorophos]|uniref:Uncharacterized protein n=1 Tax=Mycena chlorophos TaxID=658473 RepID=A0A8H6TE39_MYCCL|nr:hypothetical protein HMN09_00449700 [Mycena chlorophos]
MSVNLLDWTVDGGVSLHFAEQELASHHFHPPDFEDESIPTPRRATLPLTRTISVRSTFSDMSQDELAEDKTSINVLTRENRSQFGAALSDACSYDLSRPILDGEEVFLSPAFCVAACKSDFEPATTDFDERMEVEVEPDSSPPSPSPVSPSEIASYLAQSTISSFMPGAPFHLQLDTALNIVTSDRDSTDPHLVESAEWWWVEQEAISEGRPVPTRPARELEASNSDTVLQVEVCGESTQPAETRVRDELFSPQAASEEGEQTACGGGGML